MKAYRPPIPVMVTLAAIAFWQPRAEAFLVEDLTVAEMAARATAVVHGTVTQVAASWDETHTRIYTHVNIDVISYLSGQGPREVRIRQAGGQVGDTELRVVGQPSFSVGEQVVVFLEPDGSDEPNQWVVMCLAAGKFRVTTDETTGELVLSRDLREVRRITVGATDRVRPGRRVIRPFLLRELRDEVRRAASPGGTP